MAVRITCTNKAGGNHENPYVAISYLNWVNGEGKTGRSTREQMYEFVAEKGGHAYVQSGGSKAKLIGAVLSRGTRYVKTEANSVEHDNLLKLPECR
jgi:hypothetical protein